VKKIHSPLTGRANIEKLASYDVEKICKDWKERFDIDVVSEFHGYKHIDLYRCKETGLGFFYPGDVLGSAQLYAALQRFDWYYMKSKWEHQIALEDLNECQRVLEIGAASGAFVKAGLDSGINISGIEMNQDAVADAQRQGIPVSSAGLEDVAKELRGQLDGVCSFQVLEHISDPLGFLSPAVSMLQSGGVLILSVPNSQGFIEYDDYCLMDMPPHHMTRWSEASFRSLEPLLSVKLEKVRMEPLAAYHTEWFLRVCGEHYRSTTSFGRLLFNRITQPVYRGLLKLPFVRRLFNGHTLYVKFRKI